MKKFASFVKRVLFWIFEEPPLWQYFQFKNKIKAETDVEKQVLTSSTSTSSSPTPTTGNEIHVNIDKKEQTIVPLDQKAEAPAAATEEDKKEVTKEDKSKCNFCDLCEKCQKDKDKEKDKKKKKDATESDVSVLNYFACFVLILIEFICNMTVWLMISNPPAGY